MGIARAKADGKSWGGRKARTRVRLTEEKEVAIRRLYAEGLAMASIARTVGLDRKTVYRALARAGAEPGASEPSERWCRRGLCSFARLARRGEGEGGGTGPAVAKPGTRQFGAFWQ